MPQSFGRYAFSSKSDLVTNTLASLNITPNSNPRNILALEACDLSDQLNMIFCHTFELRLGENKQQPPLDQEDKLWQWEQAF